MNSPHLKAEGPLKAILDCFFLVYTTWLHPSMSDKDIRLINHFTYWTLSRPTGGLPRAGAGLSIFDQQISQCSRKGPTYVIQSL
jgi:hypothetical protein